MPEIWLPSVKTWLSSILNTENHLLNVLAEESTGVKFQIGCSVAPEYQILCSHPLGHGDLDFGCQVWFSGCTGLLEHQSLPSLDHVNASLYHY